MLGRDITNKERELTTTIREGSFNTFTTYRRGLSLETLYIFTRAHRF